MVYLPMFFPRGLAPKFFKAERQIVREIIGPAKFGFGLQLS
ncbi:MAG: hypothetical protein QXM37_04055 [Candidatus Bathyarchaeia archaeon]